MLRLLLLLLFARVDSRRGLLLRLRPALALTALVLAASLGRVVADSSRLLLLLLLVVFLLLLLLLSLLSRAALL